MQLESLERVLKQHHFTQGMAPEALAFLAPCVKNQRFTVGEYLFRENSPADMLYLIRRGHVALESVAPGRGPVGVETVGVGDVLGWSVLFPPHVWHLDGRAVEPTLALCVQGACLRKKVEEDAFFGREFLRALLSVVHQRLVRARLQQLNVYKGEV